jgi:hypothetical protein
MKSAVNTDKNRNTYASPELQLRAQALLLLLLFFDDQPIAHLFRCFDTDSLGGHPDGRA